MVTWPIGLSTGCFYQTSIFDCLEPIRESGFSMIEVCFSPTHLDYHDLATVHRAAQRMGELGLEAYSFHAPFAPGLDISSLDPDERGRAFQEISRAVDAAAILQVHYFVIHPGPETTLLPPEEERLARLENTIGVLNRVVEHCHLLGIRCVLENKLPHLLFGKTSDVLGILSALDSTDVGACLDTGHAFLSGDLQDLIPKLGGHLKMIHAHDNSGHRDEHLPPGDGCIHWNMVIQALRTARFEGALILEIGHGVDPRTTLEGARRGRSFLRQICRRFALAPA